MGSQRPDSPVLPRTGSCLPSYRKMGMRDKGEGREARRVRGRGWAVARLRVIGRGIEKTDRRKDSWLAEFGGLRGAGSTAVPQDKGKHLN